MESDLTLPKVNVNETAPSVQNAGDKDDLRVVLGSSRRCDAFMQFYFSGTGSASSKEMRTLPEVFLLAPL